MLKRIECERKKNEIAISIVMNSPTTYIIQTSLINQTASYATNELKKKGGAG